MGPCSQERTLGVSARKNQKNEAITCPPPFHVCKATWRPSHSHSSSLQNHFPLAVTLCRITITFAVSNFDKTAHQHSRPQPTRHHELGGLGPHPASQGISVISLSFLIVSGSRTKLSVVTVWDTDWNTTSHRRHVASRDIFTRRTGVLRTLWLIHPLGKTTHLGSSPIMKWTVL